MGSSQELGSHFRTSDAVLIQSTTKRGPFLRITHMFQGLEFRIEQAGLGLGVSGSGLLSPKTASSK